MSKSIYRSALWKRRVFSPNGGYVLMLLTLSLAVFPGICHYVRQVLFPISPEVAHQHFYNWIRGYWQAAKPYLNYCRYDAPHPEPTQWEYYEELLDTTSDVESSLCRKRHQATPRIEWSDAEVKDFLEEERDRVP